MIFLVALGGLCGCGQSQLETRLATIEELKAVTPKQLIPEPMDPAAIARYQAFVKLAKTVNQEDSGKLMMNWADLSARYSGLTNESKVSIADQQALVVRMWKENPKFSSELTFILDSGPMAIYRKVETVPDEYLAVLNAFRMLVFSAVSYGASGDYKTSADLIGLSFRLAERLESANCGLGDYLSNLIVTGLTACVTPIFKKESFPVRSCVDILKVCPELKTEVYTTAAIRTDFASQVLPSLAQDLPKMTGAGTYDAVETAKVAAKVALAAISNIQRPFAEIDNSTLEDLEQDSNVVLKLIYQDKFQRSYKGQELRDKLQEISDQVKPGKPSTPESESVRASLNKIHNSLGRMKLANCLYDNLPLSICGIRVTRDFIRIYLASRIYRGAHDGKLPESTAGFVPILGGWPKNPFDGKPYKYLPKVEKVYGVRQDLVDHGGDIGNGYPSGTDAGISLKLTK